MVHSNPAVSIPFEGFTLKVIQKHPTYYRNEEQNIEASKKWEAIKAEYRFDEIDLTIYSSIVCLKRRVGLVYFIL